METASKYVNLLGELKLKLLDTNTTPSATHWFLKKLADEKKLLRIYTQNIDDLEMQTGLERIDSIHDIQNTPTNYLKKVMQLHGHLRTLYCASCSYECQFTQEYALLYHQESCDIACPECPKRNISRVGRQRKHGRLEARVVLQNGGNNTHDELIAQTFEKDVQSNPDLVLIIGTTLEIKAIKSFTTRLVRDLHVKSVLMDLEWIHFPGCSHVLYHLKGPCDQFANSLISQLYIFHPLHSLKLL